MAYRILHNPATGDLADSIHNIPPFLRSPRDTGLSFCSLNQAPFHLRHHPCLFSVPGSVLSSSSGSPHRHYLLGEGLPWPCYFLGSLPPHHGLPSIRFHLLVPFTAPITAWCWLASLLTYLFIVCLSTMECKGHDDREAVSFALSILVPGVEEALDHYLLKNPRWISNTPENTSVFLQWKFIRNSNKKIFWRLLWLNAKGCPVGQRDQKPNVIQQHPQLISPLHLSVYGRALQQQAGLECMGLGWGFWPALLLLPAFCRGRNQSISVPS